MDSELNHLAHDLQTATTWDEMLRLLTLHRFEAWRRGLEMQRARAEQDGIDLRGFEAEKLEKMRDFIARLSIDPRQQFDPPLGVREPQKRSPGDRSSAVAVPEPDDDRASVEALGRDKTT